MSRKDKITIPCVCLLVFTCLLANLTLAVHPVSATTYDFDDGIRELVSGLLANKGNLLRNQKIAVFGMVEQTGKEQWLITASIEDGILDALVDEGYTVVERSRIDDVLKKELKTSADQWFDESQVADVGKLLGADAVITGDYTLWGNNTLRVSVRCISVSDGRVLAASRVNLHTDRIQHLLKKGPAKPEKSHETTPSKSETETRRKDPSPSSPQPIQAQAPSKSGKSSIKPLTCVVNWGNGKVYFFKGSQYIRWDIKAERADPGYPKGINSETCPGLIWTDGIDAIVNYGNGKAYFFKGSQYIRWDIKADRPDPGYPKEINLWTGLIWTDGIDAVVNWGNGKVYFFKGSEYIRWDIKADRADPGYPKEINSETWPGLIWTDGIDAAVNWGNGKVYFFKGSEYIRWDIKADRADPDYPKRFDNSTWPGMIW